MKKDVFRLSVFVLAVCLAFGGSALAQSDEYADSVADDSGINHGSCGGACDGPSTNALDAPDEAYVSLGDEGWIMLSFTDNTCLVDEFDDDVTVHEFTGGVQETFNAQVGQTGVGLASDVFNGTGTETFNVAATGLAAFNRIRIQDDNGDATSGTVYGYDLDAVTCLNSLAFGTDHITKTITGDDTIEVGVDFQQGPYTFEIEISNDDGADLTDVILKDNVPAEFDIEGPVTSSDDSACPVDLLGEVTKGKGNPNKNQKLAPDFIQIGPLDLADDESCTITVEGIVTDDDHPGNGNSPDYTPTSCPDGTITLNDGVQVFLDANLDGIPDSDELLFRDDDSLELTCIVD